MYKGAGVALAPSGTFFSPKDLLPDRGEQAETYQRANSLAQGKLFPYVHLSLAIPAKATFLAEGFTSLFSLGKK